MTKTMRKRELITRLAEATGITRKASEVVLSELVALAVREIKEGRHFMIPGLGKAIKTLRQPGQGRNFHTGETIQIPASTKVKFLLAKTFKNEVMMAGPHGPGKGRPRGPRPGGGSPTGSSVLG